MKISTLGELARRAEESTLAELLVLRDRLTVANIHAVVELAVPVGMLPGAVTYMGMTVHHAPTAEPHLVLRLP